MPLSLELAYLFLQWHLHDGKPSRYASLLSLLNIWLWDAKEMDNFPHMHADKLLAWTKSEDRQVRAMAWSGIVLMLIRHGYNMPQKFIDDAMLLSTDATLKAELVEMQKYFFTSIVGLKTQKQIQHDIFDKMQKEQMKIREKMGMADDEEQRMEIAEEGNKNMHFYVEKLNKMAQDGIDMNLGTFASLSKLEIFSKLQPWLADFDIDNPALSDLGDAKPLANAIFGHAELCDIDKYALSCAINKITSIEAMKKQIPQQILDVNDERLVQMRQAEREHNAYRYAFQTLLRFFMFSPWHHTTINPFNLTPYFTEVPILLPFIDDNFLIETSRLFLRHANYIHAATYLRSWMHRNGQTEETLRMLAQCDKHLGENTERLQCLMELEKSNPDDMYIVQETGLCLINEKRYDEALKRFFHLEVKETSPRSSARAIAWCSMMTGNITRAQRYYQKLLDWQGGPSWEDLLNAGHCAWINGDPIQASALYNRYIALHQDSLTAFDNDYDTLIYLGVSEEDICLMRETIITHKTQ